MFDSIKASLARKRARRVTQVYPPRIDSFVVEGLGKVQFANWTNPLIAPVELDVPMIAFFKKFVKEGDLVIDIGANIGDTTVPMALVAGKSGMTLGFDPNPYVFAILNANAALNSDKTNIVPYLNAISVQEEEFYLVSSEASFGNAGISPTKESKHGKFVHPEKIKGVNLENLLNVRYADRLSRLSLIKVDTEGYDKEILKSISGLIASRKPVIIAESFGSSDAEAKMELFDVIACHGYNISYFYDFKVDAEVIPITDRAQMTHWKDTVNIYAVPK
jgi:FkbM family methyltransferase